MSKRYDVAIIGAGTAGIFTAYELNNLKPDLNIIMIDLGNGINKRKCPILGTNKLCIKCNPCSIMNGFGGAGAFLMVSLTLLLNLVVG